MAQRVETPVKVSTVTESKMFAKKMHRLVKKIQDKPVDSLDVLSEMARKGGTNLTIPVEVENESQWESLLKREGLVVADVHSGWSGPCTSMFSILRKLKLDANDDRLTIAAANADNISQLAPFRNQSEPCWLFIGSGKPVKVMRGSNAPKLMRLIKSEFQHELDCIEGKAKRNLISIKYEAGRREKSVSEAIALNELIALEEEEKMAKEREAVKSPTPPPNENEENQEGMPEKEKTPDIHATNEEQQDGENEEEKEEEPTEELQESNEIAEALFERRKMMEESNIRLKTALRPYTVLAIQSYLIETGAVTEIKDHLADNFNLVRERYVPLNDDDARKLFGIPSEIPDPNPPAKASSPFQSDELHPSEDIEGSEADHEHSQQNPSDDTNDSKLEKEGAAGAGGGEAEGQTGNEENAEGDDEQNAKREKTPVRMIPLSVPEVLIGDTLILLLECTCVKPVESKKEEEKEEGNVKEENGNETDSHETGNEDLYDADYYMAEQAGPEDYDLAIEEHPKSLHALYGKEKYVSGVWCPRKYEEKRFVMLNYFPSFVTEMMMPVVPDPPKNSDTDGDELEEHEDE